MRALNSRWEFAFVEYVESCAECKFQRGTYDCLTFANGAVRAMFGEGFADDVIARGYDTSVRSLIRASGGFRSFPKFLDTRLNRIPIEAITRGTVVALPRESVPYYSLGVAFGGDVFTVANVGTAVVGIEVATLAWSAHQS